MNASTEEAFATLVQQGYLSTDEAAYKAALVEGWRRAVRNKAMVPGHATARAQALLLSAEEVTVEEAICLVAEVIARTTGRHTLDEYDEAVKLLLQCISGLESIQARVRNRLEQKVLKPR